MWSGKQDEADKRAKIRDFSLIAFLLIVNGRESHFQPEIELDLKKMLAEVAQGEEPWKVLELPSSKGVINCIISFLKRRNLLSKEELDTLFQSSNYTPKVIENKKF